MAYNRTLQHFVSSQELATVWVGPGTNYITNQLVVNSFQLYICLISHTSSASFATDLAAGRWSLISGSGGGGNPIYYRGFGIDGFVLNGTSVSLPILITATSTILSVTGYLRTAGTACNFDIKKNGVSIFSVLPSFGAGNVSTTGTLSTTILAANDVLELDISGVTGSPQDLTVSIRIQE